MVIGPQAAAEIKNQARYFPNFLFTILASEENALESVSDVLENSIFAINYELQVGSIDSLRAETRFNAILNFDLNLDPQICQEDLRSTISLSSNALHKDGVALLGGGAMDEVSQIHAGLDDKWSWIADSDISEPALSRDSFPEILTVAGLRNPTLFFQFLRYHCWYAYGT
ncbi:MAG: hypothetical protein EOP05_00205 [Proteobacteria bacterium]|nr:MAG: hypothetical protein EOP05_00205 [Pseudomonadota bacterium]